MKAETLDQILGDLDWRDGRDYDTDWEKTCDRFGLTHGACHFYGGSGSGNTPYHIVRRADGLVAFPPTDPGSGFSTAQWTTRLNNCSPDR